MKRSSRRQALPIIGSSLQIQPLGISAARDLARTRAG
jgi:hypothetical protein